MNMITILRGLVVIDEEHATYFNQVVHAHLDDKEVRTIAEGILADFKGQRIEKLETLTFPDWDDEYECEDEGDEP